MNEKLQQLAEQQGLSYFQSLESWLMSDAELEKFADLIRQDDRDKCAQDYLQDCCDAVEAARVEERESMNSILDQALKDQKDAERYIHLKHILIDSTINKKFEGSTPKDIDDLIDELVRSYDK